MKRIIPCTIIIVITVLMLVLSIKEIKENISLEDIEQNCPYGLSEAATWEQFPSDNILKITAIAKDIGETESTIVLVFNTAIKNRKFDSAFSTIVSSKKIEGSWSYGSFDLENVEIAYVGKLCYIKGTYDSRITINRVTFDKSGNRVILDVESYSLYIIEWPDVKKTIVVNQNYDSKYKSWKKTVKETKKSNDSGEYDIVTEAHILKPNYDPELSALIQWGYEVKELTMYVDDYKYSGPKYNVYGEMTNKPLLSFKFVFQYPINETINEYETVRLYKKVDGEYVDITPDDIRCDKHTFDYINKGTVLKIYSNKMDRFQEGEYKIENGEYVHEFEMKIIREFYE